jgi:cell division protein FtsI/penicillin-binding protein 2
VRLIERRIGLLFAVFSVLLILGGSRAAWLGVVRAGTLKRAAATQQTVDLTVPARRGSITDSSGTELAVSKPAQSIAVTPYLVKDAPQTAAKLARILHKPEDELLRQLVRRDTGFAYLDRGVPAARAERVQRLGLPGLEFIPEYKRVYPRGWMASQILGQVGTDGGGLAGLEYARDGALRGSDGERKMVKDALGDAIEMKDIKPTLPGEEVRLTLNSDIQGRTEEVLSEVGAEFKPKGATAIVMDPRDGSLLAVANWPQVDANRPGAAPD